MGASFEMIGVCCGVSKQALHKKWRQQCEFEPRDRLMGPADKARSSLSGDPDEILKIDNG